MTCSRSGLVAQNTNFVSPCVGPFPLLGLMLRGDNLGISKQYIQLQGLTFEVRQTKKGLVALLVEQ